jgi:hypothetical protein
MPGQSDRIHVQRKNEKRFHRMCLPLDPRSIAFVTQLKNRTGLLYEDEQNLALFIAPGAEHSPVTFQSK